MKKAAILAYMLRVDETTGKPYRGYLAEIDDTLEALQGFVNFDRPGGLIQVLHLNDDIDVICHDGGKLLNYPVNRVWLDDGEVLDFVVGNILIVRHIGDAFSSIYKSDIPFVEEHLKPVVRFSDLLVIVESKFLPEYSA